MYLFMLRKNGRCGACYGKRLTVCQDVFYASLTDRGADFDVNNLSETEENYV